MGKSSASAPTPPDPTTVDNAQAAANDQTAQFQQQLNMINTTGPNGSVSYVPSSAPGGYTQQTTLSPAQQQLYNSTTQAEQGALNIGNNQLGAVQNALNQTVTPGALQTSVNSGGIQSGYDPGGSIAYGYNSGTQIQNQVYGSGANAFAIPQAENAAYNTATQYLTPQYQQQNENLQAQLAAQGLNPNDMAYQNAVTLQNNQQNQGYQGAINSAITAGQNEQNTLYNQNLQSGEFTNAAQLQGNQENAAQATLNNAAQSQANAENAAQAGFANTAQNQAFTEGQSNAALQNTAQNQLFQQQAYAQSLPINELSSLLGLSQVSQPTGINYSPTQVGQTNALGAYQLNSQVAQNNYNTATQANNSLLGGLFGLGNSLIDANPANIFG